MKESEDYQFLKTFPDNYIQHLHISNCFNGIEKLQLDDLPLNQLLVIIEIDIEKFSKYIEQRYLKGKFNEDILIQLLCKLVYPPKNKQITYNNGDMLWQNWIPVIKYFRNLPLHIYFKIIQSNINIFENISEDTKNYNEIKEYYRFLKL
jgi:hypothetical protein